MIRSRQPRPGRLSRPCSIKSGPTAIAWRRSTGTAPTSPRAMMCRARQPIQPDLHSDTGGGFARSHHPCSGPARVEIVLDVRAQTYVSPRGPSTGLRTSEDEVATLQGPKGSLMQVTGMPAYFVRYGRSASRRIRPLGPERSRRGPLRSGDQRVTVDPTAQPRTLTASAGDNG